MRTMVTVFIGAWGLLVGFTATAVVVNVMVNGVHAAGLGALA